MNSDVGCCRKLEYPITHRYSEIKEFPVALNNSQMWNWSTRLFLTEAKIQLEKAAEAESNGSGNGSGSNGEVTVKYTKEEIDALEKTLKEHEVWLNDVVEKQKLVQMYDDPAVESKEMYARVKVLENHLQRLVKKKVPKKKTTTTATTATTASSASASGTAAGGETKTTTTAESEPTTSKHDEL